MSSTTSETSNTGTRQPPAAPFRIINPIVRGLLNSPLHGILSGRLMVLYVTGHKTGTRYAIPVGYARDGDTIYLGTERRWANNLRGGAPVEVQFQGRRRRGQANVISDVEGMTDAFRAIHAASPGYANALSRTSGVTVGNTGEVNGDAVTRARDAGHVIVRIELDA